MVLVVAVVVVIVSLAVSVVSKQMENTHFANINHREPANRQYFFKFGTYHSVLQMINTAARPVGAHLDFCTLWGHIQ